MRIYSIARQHASWLALAFATFGLIVLSDTTMAQEATPTQAAPTAQADEVTVTAPREVTRTRVGRSGIGAPVEEVSVSERVAYNDLDLKKSSDVDVLNKRIKDAAEDSCSELDRLFPTSTSSRMHRDCVFKAVKVASLQIEAAVAAAGGKYGNADVP
jgi:UrcA family protein